MSIRQRNVRAPALAVLLLGVFLCTVQSSYAASIAIGSKNFTESRLLAEIMAQLIESRTDLEVDRRTNLGGTALVFAALRAGEIDLYPEYTGTGWAVQLGLTEKVNDPLRVFLRVSREFRVRYGLTWLAPFGFNNTYALALDEAVAERLGVSRISDLLAQQEDIRAGLSHEFLNREDGYPGLSRVYGLALAKLSGMEHGLAYEALASGQLDLIDVYNTDGKLLRYKVRVLTDDRRFFPPYDAAPLIRQDTLARYPVLETVLGELSFRIDDQTMRRLNYQVEVEGGEFAHVARVYLQASGLLDKAEQGPEDARGARPGLLAQIFSGKTLDLLFRHLLLTGLAVLLAIVFAVPLGIALTRWEFLAGPALGAAGIIQTIPSLALLAFMIPIPFLGLGTPAAVAALFLYALLPILRNTYTGIRDVDPELIDAARGMGLRDREILTRVQLPLSWRTIMAGIRTSTVISVGVATLAAFIGAGGLGDPILTGLQLSDMQVVLSGAIPAALLAITIDFLLGRIEHRLVPRGLR